MRSEGVIKVFTGHTEWHMNVCTKFHGNPSHGCRDISLKNTNVDLMAALEDKSEDHQGLDQSGGQTDRHCHPSIHTASLAKPVKAVTSSDVRTYTRHPARCLQCNSSRGPSKWLLLHPNPPPSEEPDISFCHTIVEICSQKTYSLDTHE